MTPSHIIQEKAARKKYWIMAVTALHPICHKLSTAVHAILQRDLGTLLLAASSTPRANTRYPVSSDIARFRWTKL